MKAQGKFHRIAIKIYDDLITQMNPIPKQEYSEKLTILYMGLIQQKDDITKFTAFMNLRYYASPRGKSTNLLSPGTKTHLHIYVKPGSL